MSRYTRSPAAGVSVFLTARVRDLRRLRLTEHAATLRAVLAEIAAERPFQQEALVVLPDHLHAVWTLPARDRAWGLRWALVQARFGQAVAIRGALWQRRVETTVIENDEALAWHVDYCVWDPVKHGLVRRPQDWPHTSVRQAFALGRLDHLRPDLIA